jgi:hypothetical protein
VRWPDEASHLTALFHEESGASTANSWLAAMPTHIPALAVDLPAVVAARVAGEDVEPLLDQQARNIVSILCWNPVSGVSEPIPRNRIILSFDGEFEGEVWEVELAHGLCRRLAELCPLAHFSSRTFPTTRASCRGSDASLRMRQKALLSPSSTRRRQRR